MMLSRCHRSVLVRPVHRQIAGPCALSPVLARRSKRHTVRRSAGTDPSDAKAELGSKLDQLKQAATDAASNIQDQAQASAGAAAAKASELSSAAKEAVLTMAKQASAQVDSIVADLNTSITDAKAQAGSNSKAASAAFDKVVGTMIQNAQELKNKLSAKSPDVDGKIDAVVGSFASTASDLRKKVASQSITWGQAFDQLQTAMVSTAKELKGLVTDVAAAGTGLSASELSAQLPSSLPAAPAAGGASSAGGDSLVTVFTKTLQLLISLGSLYYLDKAIKAAFVKASITFPSALAGMFGVFVVLCLVGDSTANKIMSYYGPGLAWIARWLPLFYVPALVTLPLALNGIPGADLLRIVGILSVGMVATLMFTAQITVAIREAVKTPVKEIAKAKPSPPFEASHYAAWSSIAAASLLATVLAPSTLGFSMALPFGLAATVGGYLLGELVPKDLHGVLHPVVVTAVVANAGAALHGLILGWDYAKAQKVYLAKGAGPMGAGDLLMSLLGVVIISFGFRIYTQRDTMKRHFPEIFGATILSALFSLFSTAFAAKAIGLSSALARALVPRSVTVALALPIAQGLEAPLAITAAAVLLQGILGANFGPGLMTSFGVKDTIARGLAAAGTAGGLGTASLTSKEPEALPFCALSYALVGIFSTVIMSVPAVRDVVISIVG